MNRGDIMFLILSLVVISAGTVMFLEGSAFQKKANITQGTVVNSTSSSCIVSYTSDDGVERSLKAGQRKNRKRIEGEKLMIFYLIDNPDKARIFDGKKAGRKTIIWGIVLLSLFLVSFIQRRSKNKSSNNLKTTGRALQAEITGVETDFSITIMEKHPYIINCRWVDPITGREYNDSVKRLWKDPKPLLAGRNHLDVYIDRADPEKYFLDTEFLADLKA